MIKNLLSNLVPGLSKEGEEAVIDEAQIRKERIEFHRRSVRNGPVSFKSITTGQMKRVRQRELARETKRARRVQVRNYFAEQREAAVLRGHLQAAGVISYCGVDFGVSPEASLRSITWLIARFAPAPANGSGQVEVNMALVNKSLTSALSRYQRLTGQPITPLSPAYRLPVALYSERPTITATA